MGKMTTWEERDRKRKEQAAEKKRDTTELLKAIDKLTAKALDSDAYHTGEIERLNLARSAVFAVRAGYVKRVR